MRIGGGKQEECRKRAGERSEGKENGRVRRICKGEKGGKFREGERRNRGLRANGSEGGEEGREKGDGMEREGGKACMYTTGQPRVSVI